MKKVSIAISVTLFAMGVFAEFVTSPVPQKVPELLKASSGETVSTCEQWESVRRPKIVKLLLEQEYGVRPME
jgi:hypothetical protein